jgi:hypothetical protein
LSLTAQPQDSSICPDGTTDGECANPNHDVADVVVVEKEEEDAAVTPPTPEDPMCPSRPHIIRCAAKYLDINKNNKLDRVELETAIDNLPWLARGVLKIIGSVNSIMKKCDYDGDDAISIDYDMDNTVDIACDLFQTSSLQERILHRLRFVDQEGIGCYD